jgi:hypothetical protein
MIKNTKIRPAWINFKDSYEKLYGRYVRIGTIFTGKPIFLSITMIEGKVAKTNKYVLYSPEEEAQFTIAYRTINYKIQPIQNEFEDTDFLICGVEKVASANNRVIQTIDVYMKINSLNYYIEAESCCFDNEAIFNSFSGKKVSTYTKDDLRYYGYDQNFVEIKNRPSIYSLPSTIMNKGVPYVMCPKSAIVISDLNKAVKLFTLKLNDSVYSVLSLIFSVFRGYYNSYKENILININIENRNTCDVGCTLLFCNNKNFNLLNLYYTFNDGIFTMYAKANEITNWNTVTSICFLYPNDNFAKEDSFIEVSLPEDAKKIDYRFLNKGISSKRPSNVETGFEYFDTTLEKPIWWNNSSWVDKDGNPADAKKEGTTEQRPSGVQIGYIFKDTSLGKLILWDGSSWVNMDGTELS